MSPYPYTKDETPSDEEGQPVRLVGVALPFAQVLRIVVAVVVALACYDLVLYLLHQFIS